MVEEEPEKDPLVSLVLQVLHLEEPEVFLELDHLLPLEMVELLVLLQVLLEV